MRAPSIGRTILWLVVVLTILASTSAWCAVTGLISGTALDAKTKAPLSGANVSLPQATLTTVSDARGRFTITDLPPGTYTVVVSLVGYLETQVSDVVVVQGQGTEVEVAMEPTVVEAAGAVAKVTAPRVALRKDVTASEYVVTAADEQMTLSQPNDRYQFPGLVFSEPGVVPDNTFYPHIRGARANQVGYFLDGIPITEPNTNVFATNIVSIGLDRLELFTGGYPAEYGGFTGGIINQVVKRGDQMRGRLIDVGAGSPYNFGGLIYEAGDVTDRTNWYYGLNTWHTNFSENLFTSSAPTVSDHIAKVIYEAGPRDKVTLLSAHGYARYLFPFEREATFDPARAEWTSADGSDFGRQGHDLDGLTLNHRLSPTAFWSLRLSRLRHFLQLELGDPGNAFWQYRNERMMTGQLDFQRQMGDHRLSAGLWRIDSDNRSRYSVNGTQSWPWGLLDSISNNDTQNTQAYVEDNWQIGRRLTLVLGGRHEKMVYDRPNATNLDLSETSGRAGATYAVSPRFMLRTAMGRYVGFPRANLTAFQFVSHPSTEPFWAPFGLTWDTIRPDPNLPFPLPGYLPVFPVKPEIGRERDLGVEWKAGDSTLVTATWFRRDSRQMQQRWWGILHDAAGNPVLDANGNFIPSERPSDFDPTNGPAWFAANGTGTTRGLELKADRRMSRRLRGWLSYTQMDAKATSSADNLLPSGFAFHDPNDIAGIPASLTQEFPVDWNQRRTIAAAIRYEAGKLVVNPWAVMGSGFPYGQSGLDLGGTNPALVPNPNFNPDDPTSGPEQFVIPQNLVDPNDDPNNPAHGFIQPNSLKTGKNLTVSLNLSYEIGPGRQAYLQIYNLFARDDVVSYVIAHPRTGALLGTIVDGAVYYVPFSRTPPQFFAFGLRQEF